MFLIFKGLSAMVLMRSAWVLAMLAVTVLAYGAGLELAQWAVGWRFAEWADLAADAVGVALAWVISKKAQWGGAK